MAGLSGGCDPPNYSFKIKGPKFLPQICKGANHTPKAANLGPQHYGQRDKPKNVHIPSWSAGLAAASWSWQWRWVANGVRRQQFSYVSWRKLAPAQSSQPYERQLSKPP